MSCSITLGFGFRISFSSVLELYNRYLNDRLEKSIMYPTNFGDKCRVEENIYKWIEIEGNIYGIDIKCSRSYNRKTLNYKYKYYILYNYTESNQRNLYVNQKDIMELIPSNEEVTKFINDLYEKRINYEGYEISAIVIVSDDVNSYDDY